MNEHFNTNVSWQQIAMFVAAAGAIILAHIYAAPSTTLVTSLASAAVLGVSKGKDSE